MIAPTRDHLHCFQAEPPDQSSRSIAHLTSITGWGPSSNGARGPPLDQHLLSTAIFVEFLLLISPKTLGQSSPQKPISSPYGYGSKLGTPKLWMLNTKLDISICGSTSVFHFDPHPLRGRATHPESRWSRSQSPSPPHGGWRPRQRWNPWRRFGPKGCRCSTWFAHPCHGEYHEDFTAGFAADFMGILWGYKRFYGDIRGHQGDLQKHPKTTQVVDATSSSDADGDLTLRPGLDDFHHMQASSPWGPSTPWLTPQEFLSPQ